MTGPGSQQEIKRKKNIREISPIDVYKHLPKTNCGACRESNCMAFATRVVNGELMIAGCPPLFTDDYREMLEELEVLLAPPVRIVTFGEGEHSIAIGGKYVLQRHEFTYHNPSPIAIDVHDLMPEDELLERVRQIEQFSYNYIGRILAPDAIAIRSTSRDPDIFSKTVRKVAGICTLPLILCSRDPEVMDAGLAEIPLRNPLVYAATRENWRAMADLSLKYCVPLTVSAPGDLSLLRILTKTLLESGVSDLVLDPGTLSGNDILETVGNFTLIRTEACRYLDELFGFPLLGAPVAVWTAKRYRKTS